MITLSFRIGGSIVSRRKPAKLISFRKRSPGTDRDHRRCSAKTWRRIRRTRRPTCTPTIQRNRPARRCRRVVGHSNTIMYPRPRVESSLIRFVNSYVVNAFPIIMARARISKVPLPHNRLLLRDRDRMKTKKNKPFPSRDVEFVFFTYLTRAFIIIRVL